jgi:hypothetical protein
LRRSRRVSSMLGFLPGSGSVMRVT